MASRRIPNEAFLIMWWIAVLAAASGCVTSLSTGGYTSRGSLSIPPDTGAVFGGAPRAGWLRPRLAKGCGSDCTVNVWIGAYPGAQSADSANPPAKPQKIARIINTGAHETVMYDLKPFTQAEYDLVFQRDSVGQPLLVLVEISRITAMHIAFKKGKINNCHHTPTTFADADFWDCSHPRPSLPVIARASLVPVDILGQAVRSFLGALRKTTDQPSDEDPIWFSCTSGCCTAVSLL